MKKYKVGLDIGSTTVKLAVLDQENKLVYSEYIRHFSNIKSSIISVIKAGHKKLGNLPCTIAITGSGGLSVADWLEYSFEQEVIACSKAVETLIPQTDVVIELGGEDAKITYFAGSMEQRMNGNCAGGTGAFIDQMATLLNTDATGLNEYAKGYQIIYPIASRCGVFAKTDIQPLLNEGARKEDIAASIFQAVVNQTLGGLACGKPIKGNVAFLGGPLYFLPELRRRFIESLKLQSKEAIVPENTQLYVAIGAALLSENEKETTFGELLEKVSMVTHRRDQHIHRLPPLFTSEAQYLEFKERHDKATIERAKLETYKGSVYLGIDAGSTTTKLALIGENAELLYSFYGSNEGNPFQRMVTLLTDLYHKIPCQATIGKCVVTGYGEALMKAAFHIDIGEIETIAHYKAAEHFLPGVEFILDIGGQDMKCLRMKHGAIDSILLNEACSSGCGSFLEGFARSLNMTVEEFAKAALLAKEPVDLGTKCTVFMNSKVKQAQKEGAGIDDISAGLSYSVIKNALYKVIKLRDPSEMGNKVIVQGGTFHNDAVLRSLELISGLEVVRPQIAGLMGAYGAALIAKERYREGEKSSLIPLELLRDYSASVQFKRCGRCGNNCLLTINQFSNHETYISGNRCEKGLSERNDETDPDTKRIPNLYSYKNKRTFSYQSLSNQEARRGVIGIPRVLNMYENYPFWFTLLTKLSFRVILSSPTNKAMYEKGLETIPSESVCYPAKLCHGHIMNLIDQGISTIFYPCIVYEEKEFQDANNHYNCPIVTSYPEVIRNNIDEMKHFKIKFLMPFLSLNNDKLLVKRIVEELKEYKVTLKEAKLAVQAANQERERYKKDIREKGEEVLAFLRKYNKRGIVLCGKPYHIDPEINHGISELITSLGFAVLTEDSVSHIKTLTSRLRVVDQWLYNSRLYRAAALVAEEPLLEMIQLNSFGCGLDAVTSDQIAEILSSGGKMYTILKIDEGNNLGAAKIRIRSLKAAIEERDRKSYQPSKTDFSYENPTFTKQMRKTHTILAPQMSPIHFELVEVAIRAAGYQLEILQGEEKEIVDEGLKYVNNDACYPAIITIGQIVCALKSGKYDLNHTAVIISQTGGGCRATNYIAFLKLGLRKAGYEKVPIISFNTQGLEKQPGFKLSIGLINRGIKALIYGDIFMRVLNQTRPYEKMKGSVSLLYDKWNKIAKLDLVNGNMKSFKSTIKGIVNDFERLELNHIAKPKIGIVGEILIKYHPLANNNIIDIIEGEGAEVVIPDLLDFFFYCAYNSNFKYRYLEGKRVSKEMSQIAMRYLMHYKKVMKEAFENSKRFLPISSIDELARMASSFLSLGNQTGEGWLVTAEMLEFIHQGTNNIICVQPLACLPNQITGKGMFKPLKERYPRANIVPIDYDPGASSVNQLNRIKLMMSVAKKNLREE